MGLSQVTGIVDRRGGIRIVITQWPGIIYHVRPGETAYTVPGMLVQEPVPFDEMGALVERVMAHIRESR